MPRLIACVFAVPALVIFADVIGILGGGMVAAVNPKINVPFNVYYDNLVRALDYKEICKGLFKSFVFRRYHCPCWLLCRFQDHRRRPRHR